MFISLLLIVAFAGGLVPLIVRTPRTAWLLSFGWSTLVFALGTYLSVGALMSEPVTGAGLWRIDGIAAILVLLISFTQWTAMLSSRSYLDHELRAGVIDERQARRYLACIPLFVGAMLLASVTDNLGIQWIALEATTLATTMLVALYARPGSLEAAWKYLILCSTGIALGLGGVMIAFYAGEAAGIAVGLAAMSWIMLLQAAPVLSAPLMKIAFVLVLVGYGTKAGLVPMHTWLPDAHSSAPSPVSGLLSGVLLPVALVAILRFKALVDLSLGNGDWSGAIMIVFGVLSVALPAAFVLVQTDYKRLLAYSSIEHMGIVALSFGIGGIAAAAGLVHMVGHALAKSALFFGAGTIVGRFHSTKFDRVADVSGTLPKTSLLFAAGLLLLLAVPPSPLFLSELIIVSRGLSAHPYAIGALLVSLSLVAVGFVRLLMPMLYGARPHGGHEVPAGETLSLSHVAIMLHLLLLLAIGVGVWMDIGSALFIGIASNIS